MIYSFSFHVTWLLYDFFAISSLFFFLKNGNFKLYFATLFAFIFFLFLAFFSGAHFISFLSVWDNLKHLFIFFILLRLIIRYHSSKRIDRLFNVLGPILLISFCIQFLFTLTQYYLGFYNTNIAGTFGAGASHSTGYLCLLTISYYLYVKKNLFLLFLLIIFSCVINFFSENLGFYILLIFILLFKWASFRYWYLFFFYTIILIGLAFSLDFFIADFFLVLKGRFSELLAILNFSDFKKLEITASRGFLTIYSVYEGGFLGNGPGAYSEIYFLKGLARAFFFLITTNTYS